jgi:hypothetical protein
MGEAKRRKQLDPNFGRSNRQTAFEFAQAQYRQRGRGMVVYSGIQGGLVLYVPAGYRTLEPDHQALIASYSPESELVFN